MEVTSNNNNTTKLPKEGEYVLDLTQQNPKALPETFENLKRNATFTAIEWNHCETNEELGKQFVEALKVNSTLSRVSLVDNRFACDSLVLSGKALTSVSLRNNRLNSEDALNLSKFMRESWSLQDFDISYNEIGDEGLGQIASALGECDHLQVLDLTHNGLTNSSAILLAKGVQNHPSLANLNVSYNELREVGLGVLCNALKVNPILVNLNIGHNIPYGHGNIGLMASGLDDNHALLRLGMQGNQISKKALKDLEKTFGEASSIYALDLSHNAIDQEAMASLLEILQKNHSIGDLNLEGNPIGDEGLMLLGEVLAVPAANNRQSNFFLTHINLKNTQTSEEGKIRFEKMLLKNTSLISVGWAPITEAFRERLEENFTAQDLIFEGIKQGNLSAIKAIHQKGVSLLGVDKRGDTFMHAAIKGGEPQLIEKMIESLKQVDHILRFSNSEGLTPYGLARSRGDLTTMKRLHRYRDSGRCGIDRSREVTPEELIQLRNTLNAKLDQLEQERKNFEKKLLTSIQPLAEFKLRSARDTEVINIKLRVIEMVIESRPEVVISKLLNALFKVSIERFIGQDILPTIKTGSIGNLNLAPKMAREVFDTFTDWAFMISPTLATLDLAQMDLESLATLENTYNLIEEVNAKKFYDKIKTSEECFDLVSSIWKTLVGPKILAIGQELKKEYSLDHLMLFLYREEIEYFYQVDTPADMKNLIAARCYHLPKQEQKEIVQKYISIIEKSEKIVALSYQFPKQNDLVEEKEKLQSEREMMGMIIDTSHDRHTTWMTDLSEGSLKLKKEADKMQSQVDKQLQLASQSLIHLTAIGNFETFQEFIETQRTALNSAFEEQKKGNILYWASPKTRAKDMKTATDRELRTLVNSKNSIGKTALQQACFYGRTDMVRVLIDHGAAPELSVTDNFENSYYPYHFACYTPDTESVLSILNDLYRASTNVNIEGANGRTPLHTAAITNNAAATNWLIDKGANINASEREGTLNVPLHNAAMHGSYAVFKILEENGALLEKRDDKGHTPLMLAILFGVKHIQGIDKDGKPTIHFNISIPHLNIIRYCYSKKYWLSQEDQATLLQQDPKRLPQIQKIINYVTQENISPTQFSELSESLQIKIA